MNRNKGKPGSFAVKSKNIDKQKSVASKKIGDRSVRKSILPSARTLHESKASNFYGRSVHCYKNSVLSGTNLLNQKAKKLFSSSARNSINP